MSSLPKDKKDSKNIMIALAEKDLKKRYDDFQKNQLRMGETAKIDFDKEVFQVLSGGADELKFYSLEQRIRQIVNE